ncbi:MAG: hypothetical protein Q8T08_21150, partial [Ignavibacteria bacterium]|nr:hypothetical protein [Ignavibacteria bacterium]
MTAKSIIFIALIVFTLTNCKDKLTMVERIIGDILPQLVDSLHISKTNFIPPPPLFDSDSIFIGTDTIEAKKILEDNKRVLERIDKINSKLLIGVYDTCSVIDWSNIKEREYSDSALIRKIMRESDISTVTDKNLNFNLIPVSGEIELIRKSDLENKYSDIWKIDDRKYGGLIRFSRVYLNIGQNLGLLKCETYPDELEGSGYFIII